jgi:calcium-dependent protein kinase
VRIAKYAASGTNSTQHFAIKTLEKSKIESAGELEQLKREIEIMLTLDHPNIVKLYEVYEDAKYLHLVMEKCDGGELFDRIFAAGHFSEAKAAGLFKQVL